MIYLSYILNHLTPTYGNRNRFGQVKKSSISRGDIANDTVINTTVHVGTHIDMPYHFYQDGQTIEDYEAGFWFFETPLIIEIQQDELIINEKLTNKLKLIDDHSYDIIIIKTGSCMKRDSDEYWKENYGFHPDVYDFIANKFKKIRIIGFDSISVSSLQNRSLGRKAHLRFLNPKHPILLLEDMDLREVSEAVSLKQVIVSPLRIEQCDGLPCTVFGRVDD
ncbi:MAG: cyclase family protein [Candidatus Endonucleobacter sp. (ex Gigantidas childressi)]|nr:cyclase family protein [Candidatus Endonucleobacter sp. (ex Gigantidas childressi)]